MAIAAHSTARGTRSTALRRMVTHAPLATFFALSFAFTWGLGLVIIAGAHGLLPFTVPFVPLFYLGVYAPTAAALVIGDVTGGTAGCRAVLAGWTRWRVRPRWYLLALAVFPGVGMIAGLLYTARVGVAEIQWPAASAIVALVAINISLGPIGEEAGWRGFALPRLQARYGPLGASLLLGAVWGMWHSILWFIPGSGQSAYPFAAFFLGTVAQQVLFTWLANTTGGSLPVLACLHASVNITLGINGVIGAVPPVPFLVLTVALLVVVDLGLIVATRGRLAYGPTTARMPGSEIDRLHATIRREAKPTRSNRTLQPLIGPSHMNTPRYCRLLSQRRWTDEWDSDRERDNQERETDMTTMHDQQTHNKEIIRRTFEELLSRGQLHLAEELVSADYVNHEAPADAPRGPEAMRYTAHYLRRAFPDLRISVQDLVAEGDLVVAWTTLTGTQRGTFIGVAPTNRPVVQAQVHLIRIADGKAAEHRALRDDLGLLRQLGALATPGAAAS